MSEELLQRNLIKSPEKIGSWDFYNIGATSINALKEADIIRSIDYGDAARKKVDAIITRQKDVIAIIEYKHPRQFNTKGKKNNAISQGIEVARKLKTKLMIVTDTQESLWINVISGNIVKNQDGSIYKYLFDPKDPNLQKCIQEIIQSINEKNDNILPKKLVNPTALAKQIWQDVWSVSGATPENCLYTFVELFIFKYLSDLGILTGTNSFDNLMTLYTSNDDNTVLKHYANIVRKEIKELFPENPIDKTTIINGTIFVSKDQKAIDGYGTVFRKVLERFKDYGKLEHIDHDFKSKLFESFLKESISKKNWGQFFTPIKVVRAINTMAEGELKKGITICDPACGVGKFPLEFIKDNLSELFTIENGRIKQKIKIVGFDKGFDNDEQKTIILAKANMLIYFCELIKDNVALTKEFAKVFNESFILKTNSILGTLSEPTIDAYDLILTNPPYVTSGSSNLKEEIGKKNLKNYYKINAIGVEGLFMEWIVKALKANGKAFIVVPDGIFNRQNDKNLRQYILDTCYIDAIISLPTKTFFTTPKKTYILAITKKNDISKIQTDPVFTYLVSEIGESRDIYRFDIEQDDLSEAVNLYNAFKGSKKYFSAINHDKRCKIQEIEVFKADSNWSIDRWFSREENIALGIEKENKFISINDFSELIKDISATCNELSESLKIDSGDGFFKDLVISEIFNLSIKTNNSKFTKSFIEKNKGNIPVYSASKNEDTVDYGYVQDNLKDIKYFENCLTWNIDGSIGKIFIRLGRFSLSEKVIPLILQDKYKDFDVSYLKYTIENELATKNFGFSNKAGKNKIKDIVIKIPITPLGEFDLQKQKEIAAKYRKIEETKKNIKIELEKIENAKIDIGL
jgi:type I restriction enzyme M protein